MSFVKTNPPKKKWKKNLYPTCYDNYSYILFGRMTANHKIYRGFFGIGKVLKISKGDMLDIVLVKFGNRLQNVIASYNHPRRQVMTLKKGNLVSVYGVMGVKLISVDGKDGKPHKHLKRTIYAWGLMNWYVPLAGDLRAIGNGDTEELDKNIEAEESGDLPNLSLEEMDMKEVMK
jgi:hypothetical protein